MPGPCFRSWLPTVSGRLSFSSFGHSVHPNPTRYTNRAAGDERFLVCSQRRVGIDAVLPFASALAGVIWDREGDFIYVALCKAIALSDRPQEALVGNVFIVQRKIAWSEARQIVDSLHRHLAYYSEREGHGPLGQYVEREWENCLRELERMCSFSVKVEICRSGRTTIEVADVDLERTDRPSLGDSVPAKERLAHRLAAQIFYFLRDIGHHHQHHDPSTDTIVDLVRFDGTDDFGWREQVLYNIYRTIIQYKRNPQNKEFHACLGLLAYASTFQAVSKLELGESVARQLPFFHDIGLERSLQSSQAVNQLASERTSQRNAVLQNIILWVVGIVISVIGLLQVTKDDYKIADPSQILLRFGKFAVQETEILVALVIAAIALTAMLHSETKWNPRKWPPMTAMVRLVQAWPQLLSGGAIFGLGLVVVFAVIYFARSF